MDSALDRRFWPVVRSLQEMSFFDDVNLSKQAPHRTALPCPFGVPSGPIEYSQYPPPLSLALCRADAASVGPYGTHSGSEWSAV